MESTEVKKRGRGRPRKRKLEDVENEKQVERNFAIKKQALDSRWRPLVGRYVLKEFTDNGVFLGKIVYYDSGLYRVDYEDGDCEDLESSELRGLVLGDEYFDDDLNVRKMKLDQLISKKGGKMKDVRKVATNLGNEASRLESSAVTELSGGVAVENGKAEDESDMDSSSDSCEHTRGRDLEPEVEVPVIPPPQLPPSSGNIAVPEEYVGHLFSVYTFLRSYNIRLFLSPFSLDELVGAINCQVQNNLLDAIHVVLLRALKQHIEMLSSEGSELASKCLSCADWSLLDTLTWPVYVVNYFAIMGHTKGLEWGEFCNDLLRRDYYVLPPSRKLKILQILCDDVLDSAELRAEIDLREESEFGIDADAITADLIENGPRRVHPRYSKTSACKDMGAMAISAESNLARSHCNSQYLGSKGTGGNGDAPAADVDRNSDECLLCGMDGTLLCCDGCPAAYHSRCIGVGKMYIPDGPWYCPECTINKSGPKITTGTSLRGAEIFGTDVYGQVFLGTCNHLLVIKTSISKTPDVRYYAQEDIRKVLQALSAFMQHRSLYFEIIKAIVQHWHIPQSVFSPLATVERDVNVVEKEDKKFPISTSLAAEEKQKVTDTVWAEKSSCPDKTNAYNVPISSVDASMSVNVKAEADGNVDNSCAVEKQVCEIVNTKSSEHTRMESFGSVNQQTSPSDVTQQSLVDKSCAIELAACTSATSDASHIGHASANLPAVVTYQQEQNHFFFGVSENNSARKCLYLGDSFKPQAYINHYMHGEFAARAASCLAVLSSEEIRVSEAYKSGNSKKHVSDILLQTKAFSMAASRFFWPCSEKKLMEVPRERCGWCYSCKLSSSTKRGCMLNAAAIAATKGTLKILSGLCPVIGEGSMSSISTYILYMGEMLRGLTVGPFVTASYRNQWRKKVEDAGTCKEMRGLLLELEQNIRVVALSGDWIKPVDDRFIGSSIFISSASTTGTTQRCGPSGKRGRRKSFVSDATDGCEDKTFIWWRGGKLMNHVFSKASLPPSVVRRVARQGGSRKIYGINYADDSEIPKRSKQFSWRAVVERSKNASQLALQVRYLDHHVRWTDLIRTEQSIQEGKGAETEASIFRNAIICDKDVVQDKVKYAVAFGNQKHLPSRVMKTVIATETREEGKELYWFSETNVPLYLIKEYEESIEKGSKEVAQPPAQKSLNELSELQKRQLKASRRNIFIYLTCKRDKNEKCFCAACRLDALIRDAVTCSVCQGYCHKNCTDILRIWRNQKIELVVTCKRCRDAKFPHVEKPNEHLQTPVSVKVPDYNNGMMVPKVTKTKTHPVVSIKMPAPDCNNGMTLPKGTKSKSHPVVSIKLPAVRPETKQATPASSSAMKNRTRICNWGLIWKKKTAEDTGFDFRQRNILVRGSSYGATLGPICNLCSKPYNCDLMYIHCENCDHWYHADAVDLEESRLSELIGFKCCRCRRIKPPPCPYREGLEGEKTVSQKKLKVKFKPPVAGEESDSGAVANFRESEPSTPMFPMEEMLIPDDDPLLFSRSTVEQINGNNSGTDLEWNMTGQGAQKLPVRRQTKQEVSDEGTYDSYLYSAASVPLETDPYMNPTEESYAFAEFNGKLPVRRQVKQDNNEGTCEGYLYNSASVPLETNAYMNPTEELSTFAEWDGSSNAIADETSFDYSFNFEDMEFEPQTLFSFNELLESDDCAQLDGFDMSANITGDQSYAVGRDDQPELPVPQQSTINVTNCKMCLRIEPVPDLSCEICGLVIHRHCSPWVEYSAPRGNWRCGNCREWR